VTAVTDTQRRSDARKAGVLVRVSHAERQVWQAAASGMGVSVNEMVIGAVRQRLQISPQEAVGGP
jgi:predicted HicB family RNase H-like nuclease